MTDESIIERIARFMSDQCRETCGADDVLRYARLHTNERRELIRYIRTDPACKALPSIPEKLEQVSCYVQNLIDGM